MHFFCIELCTRKKGDSRNAYDIYLPHKTIFLFFMLLQCLQMEQNANRWNCLYFRRHTSEVLTCVTSTMETDTVAASIQNASGKCHGKHILIDPCVGLPFASSPLILFRVDNIWENLRLKSHDTHFWERQSLNGIIIIIILNNTFSNSFTYFTTSQV